LQSRCVHEILPGGHTREDYRDSDRAAHPDDVGYTDVPDTIIGMHERFIHEAMALCELDEDDLSPWAFRWTVEMSRPLVDFLRRASADEIARRGGAVAQFVSGLVHRAV
jgi:hypothetical protein